jgi:predicted transcriptional regulator
MELLNTVTEIVKAQVSHADMSPDVMTDAIKKAYRALKWVQAQEEKSARAAEEPAVSWEDSIKSKSVVCLECGKEFRQLTGRHLALHGLDPRGYREKHGIPWR